ncbi:uncharacterized protein LOC144469345 isoform X2 [Augochlora pura]
MRDCENRSKMALSEKGLVIGPRVPRGLAPAIEGLAREILRHRPEDIYNFAAHHFEQLIELRENGRGKTLDRASSNGKCRMLVDWIDGGNHRADSGSNRCRYPDQTANESIHETAIKETMGISSTTLTKLLTRGRRRRRRANGEEATMNTNGWSINETVKVFKKHGSENKADKGNKTNKGTISRSAQRSKISTEQDICSYPVQRPTRLSKTTALRRCHRSLSVEDVYLTKDSRRRFKENQLRSCNRRSNELHGTKSQFENLSKDIEDATVRCLKRQKSVGQIEDVCALLSRNDRDRVSVEGGSISSALTRRTRSLVNVTSNGSNGYGSYLRGYSGKEEIRRDRPMETDNKSIGIPQNLQGRRESFGGKRIEPKQRKKLEEEKEDEEEEEDQERRFAVKSNLKPEADDPESKDNGEIGESFEYEGTAGVVRNWKDSLENEETVIFPSVITRQCSGYRYSENVSERSEDDANYVILPPISVDASKPIKEEDNLALPVLLKLSEVIDSEQGPSKVSDSGSEVSNIGDGKKHTEMDASVSKTQTLEVGDCDREITSSSDTAGTNKCEIVQQNGTIVDRATKKDTGLATNLETNLFKEDSLNAESVFGEVSQTSAKSSDRLNAECRNENREKQRNIGEREMRPVGNDELKNKLIEIEAVERSIESTLISSETVLIADDGRKSVTSCSIDYVSNSESERSKVSFGNNVDSIVNAEMLHIARVKQDSPYNLYSDPLGSDNFNLTENSTATSANASLENEADDVTVEMETTGMGNDRSRHQRAAFDACDGRHQVSIDFSKDVDSNCYVLTEGSPCEIPESVTIVIIPDKDTGLRTDKDTFRIGSIDDASRAREMLGLEQQINPFGEYVVHPMEAFLLRDIKDVADRTIACYDLNNIQEEVESEKSMEKNVRDESIRVETHRDSTVNCHAAFCTMRAKGACTCAEYAARKDSIVANREYREYAVTETEEEPTFDGRTREQYYSPGIVAEPYVPGLNFDSFRESPISSLEKRNDSGNSENRSEKEIDCNKVSETNTIFSSFDTILSERKAAIEERSLSKNNHFQSEQERVANRHESRRDSSNIEEDIARELIENMIVGTLRLEETANTLEATNCFDVKSDTLCEYRAVSNCSRSGVSKNQNESEQSNEPIIDSNSRNNQFDAAIKVIQLRVREFLYRRRVSNRSDQERNEGQSSQDASVVLNRNGENVAISNDQYCEDGKCRDSDAYVSKMKSEEGSSINEQILEKYESYISDKFRHTGEFHDSLPLPLPELEISSDGTLSMNALERVHDDAKKPLLSLKPNTMSFDLKSPETCVLLTFDFPKNLQLNGDALNWSKTSVDLSSCIKHDFRDMDKSNADSFAGERTNADIDDIREPLALDKTSKSILIEEILTDDEEEEEHELLLLDNVVLK